MGTPAQIFENKKNAIFFNPKDANDLSEAILATQKNRKEKVQELKKIADSGKELVQKQFKRANLAKKFWNFF